MTSGGLTHVITPDRLNAEPGVAPGKFVAYDRLERVARYATGPGLIAFFTVRARRVGPPGQHFSWDVLDDTSGAWQADPSGTTYSTVAATLAAVAHYLNALM